MSKTQVSQQLADILVIDGFGCNGGLMDCEGSCKFEGIDWALRVCSSHAYSVAGQLWYYNILIALTIGAYFFLLLIFHICLRALALNIRISLIIATRTFICDRLPVIGSGPFVSVNGAYHGRICGRRTRWR